MKKQKITEDRQAVYMITVLEYHFFLLLYLYALFVGYFYCYSHNITLLKLARSLIYFYIKIKLLGQDQSQRENIQPVLDDKAHKLVTPTSTLTLKNP